MGFSKIRGLPSGSIPKKASIGSQWLHPIFKKSYLGFPLDPDLHWIRLTESRRLRRCVTWLIWAVMGNRERPQVAWIFSGEVAQQVVFSRHLGVVAAGSTSPEVTRPVCSGPATHLWGRQMISTQDPNDLFLVKKPLLFCCQ